MATTKRANCRFTAKEVDGERSYLALELLRGDDLQLPGSVTFEFRTGTSLEEAEEIALFLNDHIRSVAVTR